MRQWFPPPSPDAEADDEAAADRQPSAAHNAPQPTVYADLDPPGRWVALGMIASVDGAVEVGGVSGPLGGEGDRLGFRSLRAVADVVLVGAGTVRAENYGPTRIHEDLVAHRRARAQADRAALAVVTGSLDLDDAPRLFEDGDFRPIVVTTASAPADRRAQLEAQGADILEAGDDTVDLQAALDLLADRGLRRVLVEGGPGLNHALLSRGLVDEVFITLGPWLVGGTGSGLVDGALDDPLPLTLLEGRVHGDEVLLRYAVGSPR
jgi:riboflavin-specific deaminase-like protein